MTTPDLSTARHVGETPIANGSLLRAEIDAAAPLPIAGPALTLAESDLTNDGWSRATDGKWTRGAYVVQSYGALEDGAWFQSWFAWREGDVATMDAAGPKGSTASTRPRAGLLLALGLGLWLLMR